MNEFAGRVALVTGTTGIGRAIAIALCCGRRRKLLRAALKRLGTTNWLAMRLNWDLTSAG